MNTIICTLFENHYHYGVAALTNSLCNAQFKGEIFAGYRGNLPCWAEKSYENSALKWQGAKSLDVTDEVIIHFLPLNTKFHLANYKPYFMIRLWEEVAPNANAIAYFDPDIVIKCPWDFFEKWMSYGVAIVHEVASDIMPVTHPVRKGWYEVIQASNRNITHQLNNYFNSGFCGVTKKNIEFVKTWCEIIETGVTHFKYETQNFECEYDRSYHFKSYDQDAMNIAAMCTKVPLSEVGPSGMDFIPGGWIMSHATGSPKPWKKNFLFSAAKGTPPSNVEKEIWRNANGVIKPFNSLRFQYTKFTILISSLIGRFYKKI